MKQLTQQLKSGKMEILEVPFPIVGDGKVLVKTIYSVISAGTEGNTVRDARLGYVGKARKRSKELKQVIQLAKTNGFFTTYKMVMNKLEAPSPLGYSCAGEVIEVGKGIQDIKVGDIVACGGSDAAHAEIVSIPVNLCAKVPEGVSPRDAAFTTIAAIAIQGIRQAELQMGESCVVIGLGLIGQITMQVLKASGIKPIGIDIDPHQVQEVINTGSGKAYVRNQEGLEQHIINECGGFGADAVIITAGSSSLDPVNLGGRLSRQKGKVVIVGAVPTGFSREFYYKKELDLRMSCSYGPGRYDDTYEQKGIDYPVAYVRWTEKRNMQSFLDLLSAGSINMDPLISHTFSLEDSPRAYSMILEKTERFSGIMIEYPTEGEKSRRVELPVTESNIATKVKLGFIGAGSFAQNTLLPAFNGKVEFTGIATNKGNNSRYVGGKYGFTYATDNADEVCSDTNTNTIAVVTRHDLHAKYVAEGIRNSKHVFVEKPLAMNTLEMKEIMEAYTTVEGPKPHVMVGFNRRFAPHTQLVKKMFRDEQVKAISIRANAGAVPPGHWVNDPEVGGGRIIGEACHFIDLAAYLAGSSIVSVSAFSRQDPNGLNDTVSAIFNFENGSVANLAYFSNGNSKLPKERIEVFCDGSVAVIDDFKNATVYGDSLKKVNAKKQDKGHSNEIASFVEAIQKGEPCPIPFAESWQASLATLAVLESIKTGQVIKLKEYERSVLS